MPSQSWSTNKARREIMSAVMNETGLDKVPPPNLAAVRQCFLCVHGDPHKPGDSRRWDILPGFQEKIEIFSKNITQKV